MTRTPLALAVIAALALALPVAAPAHEGPPSGDQGGSGPEGEAKEHHEPSAQDMAAKMSEHLQRELELTDDQAKKVRAIMEKDAPERAELMKKLQASERKTHEAIRAVLNDEQKEKFDMMRAHHKMMGGMRGGPHGGMHGPPPRAGGAAEGDRDSEPAPPSRGDRGDSGDSGD